MPRPLARVGLRSRVTPVQVFDRIRFLFRFLRKKTELFSSVDIELFIFMRHISFPPYAMRQASSQETTINAASWPATVADHDSRKVPSSVCVQIFRTL